MTRTRIVLATTAAAAVLAAGGTAYALADTTTPPVPAATASLTVDQVIETALKAVPGRVESAERDDDGTWEATVLGDDGRWHELTVTAPGKSTPRPDDDGDDADDRAEDARDAQALRAAPLTAAQALAKARTTTQGTITGVALDDDTAAWTFEIGDRDHTLNATTGAVTPEKDD